MKGMRNALLIFVIVAGLLLPACTAGGKAANSKFTDSSEVTNYVKLTMSDDSIIVIELDPEQTPITVKNFQDLVASGFYDGLIFHRIEKDFVIQGGDPDGNGSGGPGYYIKGEFAANGVDNSLKHTRGVVSMARSTPYDSAGSQFFIVLEAAPHLDGAYAAFGTVVEGMEVADKIESDYLEGKLKAWPAMKKASFVKPA